MQGNVQRPRQQPTHHPNGQYYHAYHDFDGSAHISTTIIHALADVAGADVSETEFALNDYVDPRALDRLFASQEDGTPRQGGTLTLTVSGYHVTVYGTGQIVIQPPHGQPRA
jgi:hypothetical protein